MRSIKPQCCEAAAQSSLGMVGRPATKSLMEANSWSPLTTTIRKPRIRYILYVASKATQMTSLFLLVRWVIVVTWLGKSPTCRQHVGPGPPTRPSCADTNSFPTLFFVSGIADFLQIFLCTKGTYREIIVQTGMYYPFSQVTFLHPSHNTYYYGDGTTATMTLRMQRGQWRRRDGRRSRR